jgi:hypothetical protein
LKKPLGRPFASENTTQPEVTPSLADRTRAILLALHHRKSLQRVHGKHSQPSISTIDLAAGGTWRQAKYFSSTK